MIIVADIADWAALHTLNAYHRAIDMLLMLLDNIVTVIDPEV